MTTKTRVVIGEAGIRRRPGRSIYAIRLLRRSDDVATRTCQIFPLPFFAMIFVLENGIIARCFGRHLRSGTLRPRTPLGLGGRRRHLSKQEQSDKYRGRRSGYSSRYDLGVAHSSSTNRYWPAGFWLPNSAIGLPTKKFFLSLFGGNARVTLVAVFISGGPSTLTGLGVSQTISALSM